MYFYLGLFCLLVTFCSSSYSWDEAAFQNYLKKQVSKTCQPQSIRGLASANLRDPNLKKSVTTKSFAKFSKSISKSGVSLDIDNDGREDCKREFYKNSKQLKSEKCDMNYDGVVDIVTEFGRSGLQVKELINRDEDPFFEVSVVCKNVVKEPGLSLCKKSVDIMDQNKRTESMYLYRSSTPVMAKYQKKILYKKKQSRGVASTEELRFDEEKLPVGHSYDWSLKSSLKSLKENDRLREEYGAVKKNHELIDVFERKLDALQKESRPFMKYFMSFEQYVPNVYDGCLADGRNSCQKTVNYESIGMKANQDSFAQCMNYTFHFCNDDQGKSEGKHCFNCLTDEEYFDIIHDAYYEDIQDFGEAPEGFSYVGKEEVLIHDSCKEFIGDPKELSIEDTTWCWQTMKYKDEKRVREEDNYNNILFSHDRVIVNSKIQGLRILRALRPSLYSTFMAHLDGTSKAQPKGVPETWKVKKKALINRAKRLSQSYLDEKEDPRIKIFCNGDNVRAGETTSRNFGIPTEHMGVQFSTPAIYLDPDKLIKSPGHRGKTKKQAVNDFMKDEFAHAIAHVMGHSHGYPRKITKGPNKGKWRCDWAPEPDYAYLCEDKECQSSKGNHGPNRRTCALPANGHIDLEKGGDLHEGYAESFRRSLDAKDIYWGVVDDPSRCDH